MSGAQCLWLLCQVKSSSPQHKSGAGEVSSRFGKWNQKDGLFHWAGFSVAAVLWMALLDMPQVSCAWGSMGNGSFGISLFHFCRSSVMLKIKNMSKICKYPNKLWLSTPLSAIMLDLFEWRRQTLTTTRNSSLTPQGTAKLMTTFPT